MKVRAAIEPGRMVLRRQPDGTFAKDFVYLALVVVGVDSKKHEITQDAVPRWGSTDVRVNHKDYWVNYIASKPCSKS